MIFKEFMLHEQTQGSRRGNKQTAASMALSLPPTHRCTTPWVTELTECCSKESRATSTNSADANLNVADQGCESLDLGGENCYPSTVNGRVDDEQQYNF